MIIYLLFFIFLFLIFYFQKFFSPKNYEFYSQNEKEFTERVASKIERNINPENLSKNRDSLCIDKRSSQENILDFVKNLRNDLLVSQDKISRLENQLNEKSNQCRENQQKKDISDKRDKLVASMSGDASFLSGLSPIETSRLLNKHLSEPLTMDKFNKSLQGEKKEKISNIQKRNNKNSKKMDKFLSKKRSNIVKDLSDDYFKSNLIKVECLDDETPSSESTLGDVLLQISSDLGFQGDKCKKNDKKCQDNFLLNARKKGMQFLDNLSKIFTCQINNKEKGLFPYNLKTIQE